MIRGTTPTITINTDIDLTSYKVYVAIANIKKELSVNTENKASTSNVLIIDNATVTESAVTVTLTQEQTINLEIGNIYLQIRAINAAGDAIASNIMREVLTDVIQEGVISYD